MKWNELTIEIKRGFMAPNWIKRWWKPSIESIAINGWHSGKKIGSELRNANDNFQMVKMNSKTLLISHLIIWKSYLLLWLWFYSIFIMKHVFLIHLMLFWTSLQLMSRLVVHIYFKNDMTTKNTFILIFWTLLKMKKDLKRTFISFSSFDNSEKITPGVFFQLFSNSDNVKILSSTCHFELVKLNELIPTQYKFNHFPE